MSFDQQFAHLVEEAQKRISALEELQKTQISEMKNQRFDPLATKNAIESNLKALQESLVTMTTSCIRYIDKFNDQYTVMESDVQSVDGLLNSVKNSSTAQMLDKFAQESKNGQKTETLKGKQDFPLDTDLSPKVEAPKAGERINFNVLSKYGLFLDHNVDNPVIISTLNPGESSSLWQEHEHYFTQ